MSARPSIRKLLDDPEMVAVVVPASEVFGLLQRQFDLPPLWAALAMSSAGTAVVYPEGGAVTDPQVEELLLVRMSPLVLEFSRDSLTSADQVPCTATVVLEVQAVAEVSEFSALRRNLAGRRKWLRIEDVQRELYGDVLCGLQEYSALLPAAELCCAAPDAALSSTFMEHLALALFRYGLILCGVRRLTIDSAALRAAEAQRREQHQRQEAHEARTRLAAAERQAHTAHLAHLQELLDRLQALTERTPGARIVELLRSFDAAQRSEIYAALNATHSPAGVTKAIAVAAGNELMLFDPRQLQDIQRRVTLGGPTGALRSVSCQTDARGQRVLLVGAASGTLLVSADELALISSHPAPVPAERAVRGGYNAVTLGPAALYATHSELGLTCWRLPDGTGEFILQQRCAGATAVRHAQWHHDRLWCSVDCTVLAMKPVAGAAEPAEVTEYRGALSTITALTCTHDAVFAGDANGHVLRWAHSAPDRPEILHAGPRRSVESIVLITLASVERLFFANTSTAVTAQVLGDAFCCRYEAGGQILRRVAVGQDLVVATNEPRDRLLCWPINAPSATPMVVPVAQKTGRSIQDACLIPAAACG